MLSFSNVYAASNSTTTEHTKAFIQVWGLVKYKSINGAQGKFNADSVFLALINKVKEADENQFRELIALLLKENPGLDDVNRLHTTKESVLTKNIDYRWIKNKLFTSTIQKQLVVLTKTYNASHAHYFIPTIAYEGDLPHENAYPNYTFDSEAMNLLALAKAWNAIAYLFPYRYVMDQKWELTLQQLIPVFSSIHSRATYEKSILLLESSIDDTHASGFLNQVKSLPEIFNLKYYPSFTYKIYQNCIMVKEFLTDSLAQASSLKPGDLIVTINGVKTKEWLKQRSALLPASNQSVKNRLLTDNDAFAFSAIDNAILNVKIKRDDDYLNVQVSLLDRKDKKAGEIVNTYFKQKYAQEQLVKGYEDLPNDIALIRAGYFFDKNLPKGNEMMNFSQNLNKKKAIIFDMRKYPAAPGLFYYFIPMALGKPAFRFAQYFGADISNPGVFSKKDGIEVFLSKDIATEMPLYTGKIVILTDENTQSMGEWFTMMLRQINLNTTVIGNQTAGADGDMKHLNLPGGYEFLFTGNGIFYPNGKETQRIGIVPDVVYKPSVKDLIATTDMHLAKALQYLNNK